MNKQEFLDQLRNGFSGLPREDAEERLAFYADMIDDRMEEGLSEEEAVAAAGSTDEIIAQLMPDLPAVPMQKPANKPRNPWIIVLLVLVRNRMFKIICACGAEVCLWLACKVAFGPDALLSQIMTWVTALAVIALMIAIVNRIDWGSMRSKKH